LCQMLCVPRGAPQQGPFRQTRRQRGGGKRRPLPYKQGAMNANGYAAGLHTSRWQEGIIMNKTELIERIAEEAGVTASEAQKHFGAFERVVTEALKGGEEVRITGFGKFSVKERKAREGRNPQTGEKMEIAASKVPSFSAGNALKQAI
jgi:DNA-binding protein HU-beta